MKIVVIYNKIPLPFADIIYVLKMANGFYNIGHKIEILNILRFVQEIIRLKIKEVHKFFDINQNIDIKYFRGNLLFYLREMKNPPFKYNPVNGIIKFIRFFPKLYDFLDPEIKISRYCVKNKIDLAFCKGTLRAAYNNIVNKVPTIIDLHGYKNIDLHNFVKLKKNRYFKGITTISEVLKIKFIKHGFPKEKILVLEDAVELEKFDKITNDKIKIRKKLGLPLDKKIILYSGKIREDRGIDTIMNAAKLLDSKEFSFYFLGGTKYRVKRMKKYQILNNIDVDINFLGFKQNKMVPYYLKAADILLATFSSSCPTLKWMSPMKIFEYMGSKTPFIATKIGRITEICNNNECLLTNPEDPRDLSEKIKILIKNKELQTRLVQNAYAKVKNHTYKKRCKKILDFIK